MNEYKFYSVVGESFSQDQTFCEEVIRAKNTIEAEMRFIHRRYDIRDFKTIDIRQLNIQIDDYHPEYGEDSDEYYDFFIEQLDSQDMRELDDEWYRDYCDVDDKMKEEDDEDFDDFYGYPNPF